MPRNRAARPTASATAVPTTDGKTIYATDLGPPRPLSNEHAGAVERSRRELRLGQVEVLPHGTLRCERDGSHVVVAVRKGGRLVGRELRLGPFPPERLVPGARFREADFTVEVREFIGTPWHELEYTSIWTVAGLRKDGEMERSIDG